MLTLMQGDAAGLIIGPPGVPLFGTFGAIVLVMVIASLFGGRSGSHGNPSGLGLVVGFMVVLVVTLALNVALG